MKPTRRGRTLLEVLIAGAIFSILATVLVLTMQTSRSAELKVGAQSEAQRACLTALSRLRTELRGVQILLPTEGTNTPLLRFRRPLLGPDGMVLMTASGEPSFNPSPVTVTLDSKGTLLTNETPPKVLGHLFKNGSVTFNRISTGVLEVDLSAAQRDGGPERKSQSRIVSRIAVRNS
jgi:prepilin-type N-terminal cleavage/methylation domain-containing protein